MDRRLNWIPDPAPTPPRDHGKEDEENHPPTSQSPKLPQKIRPRRRKRGHHEKHLPGMNGNAPGIDLRPRGVMWTPVKHPQPSQLPQHLQHPRPATNKNSSRVNPWNQPYPGRLYKQAPRSRGKESTKRSRRDNFSGSSPSFSSKRPRRDYFSGLPYWVQTKKRTLTDPQEEAISLSQSDCYQVLHHPQTPPLADLPDSVIEVGLEPPEAASTSRIPREERPPVVFEIPSGFPELEELPESHQCPDPPGEWFQPPTRSPKRLRFKSPSSPRRPRKHFSSFERWCE